jgi:glycosyltransferase involved in cell wall biosynthesis
MNTLRLSLIVSTFDRPEALEKVLCGLERQTHQPQETLVADDGSGPPTHAVVERWKSRLPLQHVWHPHDGFRKTVILNRALALVTGDYVVFLDGDCVPHERFIEDHRALAEPGFWVQGRRCFVQERFVPDFEPGQTPIWRWLLARRITGTAKALRLPFPIVRRNREQRGILGCNMGFWRDDLVRINGLDEAYAGWGIGEDSDLGTRLYHLGRPRKFVYAHAVIYHLNHPMAPRPHLPTSLARLEQTIRSRKVRCERGLDQYLTPVPKPSS